MILIDELMERIISPIMYDRQFFFYLMYLWTWADYNNKINDWVNECA
jgi:hypothetical protein